MAAKKVNFGKELEALSAVLEALGDLEPAEQEFVMQTASGRLGLSTATPRNSGGSDSRGAGNSGPGTGNGLPNGSPSPDRPQSVKQFLKDKKPDADIQRIAVLGYYLNNYADQDAFNVTDLIKLNTEAGGVKIGNPHRAMDNATRGAGFLTNLPGKKKKVSALGEEIVEALPDQAEVKRIQAEQKGARRRTKTARKSTARKSPKK